MPSNKLVFVGIIASSNDKRELSIYDGYLTVEQGKIINKGTMDEYLRLKISGHFVDFTVIQLTEDQFLMPGFIDCHTHAPQFPNIGLGLDLPLLDWLDKYTFPLERQYSDVEFASKVYDTVVERLLKNGTTTACYFGSLHLEGTLELVKSAIKYGQRALVGKVSMNIKNDVGYYNDTEKEINDVETFLKTVLDYKNDLVQPVVTPRFAISCDKKLMTNLARLAQKYKCRIQSHVSENLEEIEFVLKMNSECTSYGDVYDKSEILNERCIMAHAVHLTDEERALFVKKGVSVAHCPASNTRLMSGLCPVRKLMDDGINVGLGTDVSGGDAAGVATAMRGAMDVATALHLLHAGAPLRWTDALYLATLGGAKALNLDNKVGSFEIGKEFDALLVDVFSEGSAIDKYPKTVGRTHEEEAQALLQRFVYLGDDRNIVAVYVKGQKVIDKHQDKKMKD